MRNGLNITLMKKTTIAILGPKGSYSDQAGFEYSKDNNKIFFDSINEVILALSSKKIEEAILPLENSIHGTILETLDGLYNHDLKINKEIILKIDHVLAGVNKKVSANKVKYIYSHPQALGQCKVYLQKKYPKAKLVLTPSTSFAVKKVKDEGKNDSLAIGSKFAVDTYGLSVVDEGIQDVKNNQTLFAHISKSIDNKNILPFTFFVIDPKTDRVGTLYEILSIFKEQNINLLKIESRPSTKKLGKYIFYIKAEISSSEKKRILILKELRKIGKVTLITK
jgi:prephenate dehydratase